MIEKILSPFVPDVAAKSKAKKAYGGGETIPEADGAEFSLFAVELARISGELKNTPEVRQDLVDDFKKKIEAGEYHPPLEKIAHNLFLAGILNVQE
jgi:anti-sigma28 factor (negative regulator of flagellin synthesis)